jgi:CheY-like chemotaxis protein
VSPNTSRDGYGLGLSIVDRMVQLLGARLDVESQVGRGSRFVLELPAGQKAATAWCAGGTGRAMQPAAARVLLVEDDASVRNAARMLLSVEGYEVTTAGSLSEAVREAGNMSAPPDIVVTDYHLGGTDTGLDVVMTLRKVARRELPAVMITGDTSSAVRALGRDHGLHLVSKPIEADQFLAAIRDAAPDQRRQ